MSLINSSTLGVSSALGFFGAAADFFGVGGSGPSPAIPSASGFSNIFAFGDSLSDAGNDFIISLNRLPVSPPYVSGHFTNGPVWVQDLASTMGLPAVQASLSGGTDFAFGGAETGDDPLHSSNPLDLPSQLQQFEIQDPHPAANALYTLSAGSNDVLDAVSEFFTNQSLALADVQAAVNNVEHFVAGLAGQGAVNFLLLNVPDLGKTPEERSQGAAHRVVGSTLAKLFDQDLKQTMGVLASEDHLNIHIVNTYRLIDNAVAHPHRFGLNNVKQPVWTGNLVDPNSGKLASTNPAVQNKHLFWDNQHPTAHAHAVLADKAHTALFS
jgi:phospholipase/lecithinase/hemolysin